MQWDASTFAGFSRADPWLPLAGDFAAVNVARERGDPASLLNLYRRLIAVRRQSRALTEGSYRLLAVTDATLAYLREAAGEAVLVALNFAAEPAAVAVGGAGTVLVWTDRGGEGAAAGGSVTLPARSGAVIALAP
jgi:alpha-glucosidase